MIVRKKQLLATAIVFVTVCLMVSSLLAADATPPSIPILNETFVKDGSVVHLSWDASTDDSPGTITYEIYRHTIPVTSSNIGSLSVIATTTATSIDITPAALEAEQRYTHFYVVRAVDAIPNASAPSMSRRPNPHGEGAPGNEARISGCLDCHSAHVADDHSTDDFCYTCHGDTTSSTTYGAKSTFDVENQFFDYGDQTAGSQHKTSAMEASDDVCDACHTPHRRPYARDTAGDYDAANTFGPLLRVETDDDSYTYYSRATAIAGNAFCMACHGTTSTNIDRVDTSAYGDTAGDHETGFSAGAHSDSVVMASDTNPGINCEACHHRHGSATVKLIDYRSSGTTNASTYAQANLCFACHKTSSSESDIATGYSAPFAWNDRDVQAEFARTSHHPYAALVDTQTPISGSWTQTTEGQFGTDTLTSVETTDVGSAGVL